MESLQHIHNLKYISFIFNDSNFQLMPENEKWNYRLIALLCGILWYAIYRIAGNKYGIHWYALMHSIISSFFAVICIYLDIFAAENISGTSEPLRTIRCEGPLTPLHSFLPTITLGYAFSDILYGLSSSGSSDVLIHGVGMGSVLIIVCELGIQHTITPMILMELSSIPLNLYEAYFLSPNAKVVVLILFAILFALIRVLFVPYMWIRFLWTFYEEIFKGKSKDAVAVGDERDGVITDGCFPDNFIYIILTFGLLFHGLNFFWFGKIIKKIYRRINRLQKSNVA